MHDHNHHHPHPEPRLATERSGDGNQASVASALLVSAGGRLAVVGAGIAGLWLAVFWAL